MRSFRWCFPASLLLLIGCSSETATAVQPSEPAVATAVPAGHVYRTGRASRDGIGKFYFDREIAQVMGHRGASWLERPSRQLQERTDLLVDNLPLDAADVVADIGAGTGYFSFPVAARVPQGRVYAVDIQPEMLAFIRERARADGIANVEPVLGDEQSVGLPAGVVDLAFIVDAYHEFSHPREMGDSLVRALKPGGLLVLVEYRAEDSRVPIKTLHKMSEAQVQRELTALGLRWERTESYLPQQHVLVFRKPT